MKRTKFDGILNISGGTYEDLSIDGVCNCTGDIEAQRVDVNGILNCDGTVTAEDLDCDGVSNVRGNVRATTAWIAGVFNVGTKTGEPGKMEATKITCDGVINVSNGGELSADLIEAEGFITAGEIVGDKVVIRSKRSILMRWLKRHFSKVGTIEATTVDLHAVTVRAVNGRDITIGADCVIERLDCTGTLKIDPTAEIRSITGEYTLLS